MNIYKMLKLVVLAVLLIVAMAACSNPTQTETPVVKTETPEPSITQEIISTETPAPTPTATEEPLYAVRVSELETESEDYGAFFISWRLVRDPNGLPMSQQRSKLMEMVNNLADVCPFSELAKQGDYAYVAKHSDNREAMLEDCWKALEDVSGKTFVHSDPNIGDPRVETCSGSVPCNLLDEAEIEVIKDNLSKHSIMVAKGAQYFTVTESYTRVEPNIADYPGMGLRFSYPSEVRLEGPVQVPQLGIINWSGTDTLCINLPGTVGEGEGSFVVPGNTSQCITGKAMAAAFADQDYWAFESQAVLEDGLTLTWYWTAEMRGETLILHIMDVVATQFTRSARPDSVGPQFHLDPASLPARDAYAWQEGELVKVLEANYSYQRMTSHATDYTGWRYTFESAVVEVNGDVVKMTTDFVVSRPCSRWCSSISTWEMPIDLVGETLIVDHIYTDSMTGVWFESTIPVE